MGFWFLLCLGVRGGVSGPAGLMRARAIRGAVAGTGLFVGVLHVPWRGGLIVG